MPAILVAGSAIFWAGCSVASQVQRRLVLSPAEAWATCCQGDWAVCLVAPLQEAC